MLEVEDNVTPRYHKGEGGYEDVKTSKRYWSYCCVHEDTSYSYFSDIWFSSVKNVWDMVASGVDYCRAVKTSHKGYCLTTLEKLMKDWPGDSYLVMKSNPGFPVERPLLSIGYKYNSMKVLGFIAT